MSSEAPPRSGIPANPSLDGAKLAGSLHPSLSPFTFPQTYRRFTTTPSGIALYTPPPTASSGLPGSVW